LTLGQATQDLPPDGALWHNRRAMKRLLALLALAALTAAALTAAGPTNHPTGTTGIFMVDKLGAHVRFFDPNGLTERSSLQLPTNPHDFAFSADRTKAYVPIYGPGIYGRNPDPKHHLYVIDLTKRAVAKVIDLSPYKSPHGIQIAPDGSVYVTAELDRKIIHVDPERGRILDAIDVEGSAHWMAMLPDGSKMYVANKNDKPFVTVVDLKTKRIVARVPMPKGTEGIAASPDGRVVVAMDHAAPVAVVIDAKTDQITDRITLQGQSGGAYKAFFSPDGKWLLTMVNSMITVLDASNLKGVQQVLKVGASPMGIGFSADGTTALIANHGDGTVSVLDLATARVTKTFKAGTGIETLAFY
jgi:YVTN family beta-propeller protein